MCITCLCPPYILCPCLIHISHPPVWAQHPSAHPYIGGPPLHAGAPHIKPHHLRGQNQTTQGEDGCPPAVEGNLIRVYVPSTELISVR